ncbi:YkvA family protein [Cytobacillus gottheilii]|uniref:YkvA family protein n=1 Tax=Cytobacillus gottheilii TaxID=859144 RepID=UPI00346457F6
MRWMKRVKFIFKFWKFIPFLKEYFLSREVSMAKKVLPVAGVVAYILLPFDIIPDFLTIFGVTDDIVLTTFLLQQMVKMAPERLKEKYKVLND